MAKDPNIHHAQINIGDFFLNVERCGVLDRAFILLAIMEAHKDRGRITASIEEFALLHRGFGDASVEDVRVRWSALERYGFVPDPEQPTKLMLPSLTAAIAERSEKTIKAKNAGSTGGQATAEKNRKRANPPTMPQKEQKNGTN